MRNEWQETNGGKGAWISTLGGERGEERMAKGRRKVRDIILEYRKEFGEDVKKKTKEFQEDVKRLKEKIFR